MEAKIKPVNAPDIVLIGYSGHTTNPGFNTEYLQSQGTLDEIAQIFQSKGLDVLQFSYADELYNEGNIPYFPFSIMRNAGFLQLMIDLDEILDQWIQGVQKPTLIVWLCHSHGCVWSHIALRMFSRSQRFLPVLMMIDIDGNAASWESSTLVGDDWAEVIKDYQDNYFNDWWFDPSDVTDVIFIPGQINLFDIEDVSYDNILFNIEYRGVSSGPIDRTVADDQENYRLSGTRDGIFTFEVDENHSDMDNPGSVTINHLVDVIQKFF